MMKTRYFALVAALIIGACTPSGYNNSTWDRPGGVTAQQAPSPLTPEVAEGPAQQPAVQQTEIASATQAVPGQQPAWPRYGGTPNSNGGEAQYSQPGVPTYGAAQTSIPPVATPAALPPVKVALLVPLSGKHADLGQAMLQAAQLALFDMGYSSMELLPRDTKNTPEDARKAAQSAVDAGAQLILGPLFAASVQGAKPVVAQRGVNMITFSTDWTLADQNTYVMGFLPFGQVQRIAEYAAQTGHRNVGVLAPDNAYGNAVISAFTSAAYRSGLNVAKTVRYPEGQSDLSAIVSQFTDSEARKARVAAGGQDVPPFDAVLLPVGGGQIRSVASLLSHYDLPPSSVKRLGTGLWDDPALAGEPALRGAAFSAPSPDLRRDFERRFAQLYGYNPPRLSTLAYDATSLAAVLARNSYYQRGQASFDRNAILNPNGFAGLDGIFRFRPDGLVERGQAILEFKAGEILVASPPPTTFQRGGM